MRNNLTRTGNAALLATLLAAQAVSSQTSPTSWNVVEAGAKGDGQADGTPLFQRLLDEAGKAGGGVVEVPAGRFRINGHLTVPANVTLQGIFRVPPTTGPRAITNLTGSVLLAYEGRGVAEGPPFIRLAGRNSAIAGLIIAYPEWKQSDVPPVPYPPCVLSQDSENVGIRDCLLLNPYEGIRLIRAHRHLVRNVTGYRIWRGIYVDGAAFHTGARLRRDRIIRNRLREGPLHWTVVELRAPDLARGAALVEELMNR